MGEKEIFEDMIFEDNDSSFSPFGYAFQADAGLYLFCEFYDSVDKITIESRLQDIELQDKNGNYIMAQAKASQDPYNCSSFGAKLQDALFSLAKHQINSNDKLIYVTNIPNLFGDEMINQFNDTLVCYSNLSKKAKAFVQEKYSKIISKLDASISDTNISKSKKDKFKLIRDKIAAFNFDNLIFISITRYTDDFQKKTIKEKISAFLTNILKLNSNKAVSITDKLIDFWHDMFMCDCETRSSSNRKSITKSNFCWPIITLDSLNRDPIEIADLLEEGYDEIIGAQVKQIIDDFTINWQYEILNEIISSYRSYIPDNKNEKKNEFIINNWRNYSKYFNYEDSLITKAASIYFLYCTLSDYYTIQQVIKGKDL